jgi:DNA-binding response OmpR family regulator
MLRKAGATILLAPSAATALGSFSTFAPDVVIAEISPEGNAPADFIRAIRSSRRAETPVLALGEDRDDERLRTAIEAGYDAFLVKPLQVATLVAAVEKAVEMGRSARQAAPRASLEKTDLTKN